jgi:branched-chain amino acid transport system substrate-binding protein
VLARIAFYLALLAIVLPTGAIAQDKTPYELNAILSVTGAGAFIGAPVAEALKIVEKDVNATGGIHGRPLKINELDDGSNPQVTLQLVSNLPKSTAVFIGPMLTASCSAVVPLLLHGPVGYCSSPFLNPPAGSYMFVQGGKAPDFAVVALRYLKERGLHRIAMLNATDGTGQATDKALVDAFGFKEFKDMHLLADYHFAPTDVSVAAQVAQIKALNPQAIVTLEVGPPFGTVMHDLYDAGLNNLPIIATAGNASVGQMKQIATLMPADLQFVVGSVWVDDSREPKAVLAQIARFRRMMSSAGVLPDGAHAAFWDPTLVVIDALRHLPPNPTADQVRGYISELHDFAGAEGIYDFRFGNQSGAGQAINMLAHFDPAKQQFFASSLPGGHVIR